MQNFQNIKIVSVLDKTTTTNKPYKSCEVLDEKGESFKVNIWSDFPDFANLKEGSVIKAELKQKGQYWNIYSETQSKSRGGASSSYRTAQIEKVMDRKESSISKFQSNKEEAIAFISAQRDAVLLTIACLVPGEVHQGDEIKEEIIKWRNWFLSDDFKEHPPF